MLSGYDSFCIPFHHSNSPFRTLRMKGWIIIQFTCKVSNMPWYYNKKRKRKMNVNMLTLIYSSKTYPLTWNEFSVFFSKGGLSRGRVNDVRSVTSSCLSSDFHLLRMNTENTWYVRYLITIWCVAFKGFFGFCSGIYILIINYQYVPIRQAFLGVGFKYTHLMRGSILDLIAQMSGSYFSLLNFKALSMCWLCHVEGYYIRYADAIW